MPMCVCPSVCMGTICIQGSWRPEVGTRFLVLELQLVERYLLWVLGTDPRSSVGAARGLNH